MNKKELLQDYQDVYDMSAEAIVYARNAFANRADPIYQREIDFHTESCNDANDHIVRLKQEIANA